MTLCKILQEASARARILSRDSVPQSRWSHPFMELRLTSARHGERNNIQGMHYRCRGKWQKVIKGGSIRNSKEKGRKTLDKIP